MEDNAGFWTLQEKMINDSGQSVSRPGFGHPNFESSSGPASGNWILFSIMSRSVIGVGFCANVIALYIMHRCRNMKDFNTNEVTGTLLKYLLSLDVIATAVHIVRSSTNDVFSTESFFCDWTFTTNLLFSWSTGFINMALCVERCIALAAPFWYYSHASTVKAHVVASSCILTALLLCLLPVIGLGSYRKFRIPYIGTYVCISPADLSFKASSEDFAFAVIFLITGIGILFVIHVANIIVVVNIIKIGIRNKKIGVAFRETSSTTRSTDYNETSGSEREDQQQQSAGAIEQGTSHKKLVNKEIRLALMIVALSFVFTVGWLPYYIDRSFKAFSDGDPPMVFLMVSIFFLLLNHILDPFVYVFLKSACRRELFRLIRQVFYFCCRCIKKDDVGNSNNSTGLPAQ